METERKIIKLGGSLVITIPRKIVEKLNLKRGEELKIILDENKIIITKPN